MARALHTRLHMRAYVLAFTAALALGIVSCSPSDADFLDDDDLADFEASAIGVPLKAASVEVLTLNEDAFESKLRIIDRAEYGDTLDITYYIVSDDESSALYATRLVEAAKRGARVRVLLDYITNFSRYHMFRAMRDEVAAHGGDGSLEFRFYGKPSANIVSDVAFLVTPCALEGQSVVSAACTQDRRSRQGSAASREKARQFLTGLYGKSGAAMQASLVDVATQFEEEFARSGGDTDMAAVMQGLRLLYNAKVKGSIFAGIAVFFLSSTLEPLELLYSSMIPEEAMAHRRDWNHITDFTHQKLTLRTGSGRAEMVVGGRNIENSYNISSIPSEWSAKYVFMDVDSYVGFDNGADVRTQFEKMWNFRTMVASMDDDLEVLTDPFLISPAKDDDGNLIEVPALFDYSYEPNEDPEVKSIVEQAQKFEAEYGTWDVDSGFLNVGEGGTSHANYAAAKAQFPSLSFSEGDVGRVIYLENTHQGRNGERLYGTDGEWNTGAAYNKNIHEVWYRTLRDTCKHGKDERVILHNAYTIMPSRLQYRIFEALRTPSKCPGVKEFIIITNSRASTDLNVVNLLNESYLKPLLETQSGLSYATRRLHYFEYNTDQLSQYNAVPRSLHAKVMIFGDSIFIGSANLDGRSLLMDANNGIFLQDAPEVVGQYKYWLDTQVLGRLATFDPRNLINTRREAILDDNVAFFETQILARWAATQSEGFRAALANQFRNLAYGLYWSTREGMGVKKNSVDSDDMAALDVKLQML